MSEVGVVADAPPIVAERLLLPTEVIEPSVVQLHR
jgi:hypothetical protein